MKSSFTHKAFLTGLLLLLPLIITIWLVKFIILFITDPFLTPVHAIVDDMLPHSYFWHGLINITLPFLVLIALFLITSIVGLLAHNFILKMPIRYIHKLFKNTPIIRRLYTLTHDIFKNFMKSKSDLLKNPVVIPFPNEPGRFVMGFLTSNTPLVAGKKELYPIVLPTAPHPIAGYLLFYAKEDIHCTDISTEDAMRFSLSMGSLYNKKKWRLNPFKSKN